MRTMLAIAAGGACGALLRFWVTQGAHALFGRGFPLGTLAVNVTRIGGDGRRLRHVLRAL